MLKTLSFAALAFVVLISSGCVTRTITDERPRQDGSYGSASKSRVKEQKRVWIWQKDFRNP